ncbi:MAG TPA: T9SS type A sorting domain-containing protein [Niastella sp.]
MKTCNTPNISLAALIQLLFFIVHFSANAQPRYDFRNSSKISGTSRQVGALYRFPNVRSGVDALVSITAITGGLTINTFDGTSSGFDEAFQPIITIPAHSSGYAEFNITFVTSGTTTPIIQTEIPITPIDVDGEAGEVYEFDEIFRYSGSYVNYDLTGNEVQVSYPTANLVTGTNTGGITYDGVDTTAKEVMFSVVNANISSLVIRVGANNVSNQSHQRLRSIYFQKFTYPNSVLAISVQTTPVGNNNVNNQPFFKVYPSIFNSTVNINFKTEKSGVVVLRLVDYSGKVARLQTIKVREGNNKFLIDNWDYIAAGSYIVLITQDNITYTQKVLKQ